MDHCRACHRTKAPWRTRNHVYQLCPVCDYVPCVDCGGSTPPARLCPVGC